MSGIEYCELQAASNFSFLRGASHPEELTETAHALGYRGLAITDHNTLAGVVRSHVAARGTPLQAIMGARLELRPPAEGSCTIPFHVLAYPLSRKGYGNLCRLLSVGKLRAPKGECHLDIEDLARHATDLAAIAVPPVTVHDTLAHANRGYFEFWEYCRRLREIFTRDTLSIALAWHYAPLAAQHWRHLAAIAERSHIPLVATNDVHYHAPERRPLQDVLTCIRHRCTIAEAGARLLRNAERHLKPLSELQRLFREHPRALARTIFIAEQCKGFSLDQLKYEYPEEICPEGASAPEYLRKLTYEGAIKRYPRGIPEKVRDLIEQELTLIRELEYERYFLTCHEIVRFARSKNILCQGRGAAANSAVCFCLEITSVDPFQIELLFARFISKERNEPPDIDIDFEHERREEVIQHIYERFTRERAGLTCEVICYRRRSAVRDVGKALGLPLEAVDKLAGTIHRWTRCKISDADLREIGLDPRDHTIENCLELAAELHGFPRHLSQHVGGFIISHHPLTETVPILNAAMPDRTIIEWDKDDIEALGMLKIDVLGLGMLTCIRKSLELVNRERLRADRPELTLASIPAEDPDTYAMIQEADTMGVFQIESRAQMSMLPRLKPACLYDLVIEVAIVRPGPIQGNMVHPFLKRRAGLEEPRYPTKEMERILGKTMGVPIFQEQAMRLVIALAKFSPGEAEMLRRSMAAWKKNKRAIDKFRARIVQGMLENGFTAEFADTCVHQIQGFGEYGFPESHAASFALLVYASAWIKCHHPAHFAAGLLNSQPMGFYGPSQLVRDAQDHGVEVLPIDVNKSGWDCSLEHPEDVSPGCHPALRLGMRLVKGLQESQAELIAEAVRSRGAFVTIRDLWNFRHKEPLQRRSLEALARADAFGSFGLSSRQALWDIHALPKSVAPLDTSLAPRETKAIMPSHTLQQSMFQDYDRTGLSLKAHPLQLLRPELARLGVRTAGELRKVSQEKLERLEKKPVIRVAGIGIIRQRPGTAKGFVFISLEDETGILNLVIKPKVFARHQDAILSSTVLLVEGILERVGRVTYIDAKRLQGLDGTLEELKSGAIGFDSYSY